MSWNLRNKQYYIFNEPYSKEEYLNKIKEFNLRSTATIDKLKKDFWEHIKKDAIHRENYNVKTSGSKGNFLANDKNCQNCYFLEESENCRHIFRGFGAKDSIESVSAGYSEKVARTALDQWSYKNICNLYTTNCRFSAYLDICEECEYCFGCVGLKNKKYCILNKQYTKEEYEKLRNSIIDDMKKTGEWGKFFPLSAAYSGYNISVANIMFPLSKDEVMNFGAKWEDISETNYDDAIDSNELPDNIGQVGDEIIKQRIICPKTKWSYNITSQELAFYREHGIPLPRYHFDWRTLERFKPFSFMVKPQKGNCYYCKKDIEHYYGPELNFQKIACVGCYQQEVI